MTQKSEFLDVDLLNMKPIPGESLTAEPGKFPWEKPPRIVKEDQALHYVLNSTLGNPSVKEDIMEAIDMGMTVDTIVSGLLLNGFTEGIFTPDVAELIKVPLMKVIIQEADQAGIEDIQISNLDLPKQKDEILKLDIMKTLNPQKYENIMSDEPPEYDLEEEEELGMEEDMMEEPEQGFVARKGMM